MYLYRTCLHVFAGRPVIGGREAFSCPTKCATPATCVALHPCTCVYTVQSLCKLLGHTVCLTVRQIVCHSVLLHIARAQCVLLHSVCKAFAFAALHIIYHSCLQCVYTQCCQPSAFWLIKLGAGGVPWGSSLCPLGPQLSPWGQVLLNNSQVLQC